MGASWRTTTTVVMTILQIQALISVKTKVTGVEGQTFDFMCKYQVGSQNDPKSFCRVEDHVDCHHLIQTDKHNQWVTDGRFSLYDNTSEAFFIVRVDTLISEDSGTYRCEVDISFPPDNISLIQLNVSPGSISSISEKELTMDKLHLPLYVTAVMCVAAILSVCLFTLCLLLAVKQGRSEQRLSREISSDYETMMPGVGSEHELCCSCSAPDCDNLSALPPPPPDLCSHLTSKHRESAVTLSLVEYVNVDVQGHVCQYHRLDLSQLEEHVYHSLHGNSEPKDGHLGVKEQIDC